MPKVDGREALSAIKSHPEWRRIPVVVLTTSGTEEDISRSYDLGVNSYIRKPATFAELVEIVDVVGALRTDADLAGRGVGDGVGLGGTGRDGNFGSSAIPAAIHCFYF